MENNFNFTVEPEKWFYNEYDGLLELAINNNLENLLPHIKVYFVMRTLFDEVMNGGFGQFISNSSRIVINYVVECAKQLNIKKLTLLIEEAYSIISKPTINLTHSDNLKLEELSNDFYSIDDEYNLYDSLDKYYLKSNRKFNKK